jgi:hypothetical protein
MRVPAHHLPADAVDHIGEGEGPGFLGHLGVICNLEEQIAELIAQITHVASRDGVGNLISLFDGVRGDGAEILLEIPWAPRNRHA